MLIGAGVSLDFAIADALEVLADAKWTDFIIGQALENSAKYGAKTIRFEGAVRYAGTKGGCIELIISDDGDGIPAADVPRVFDRGFTGSRGRAHHKATGMGLYLAAVACERMGLKAMRALSLPGRVAPKAAGEIIKNAVYNITEEDLR